MFDITGPNNRFVNWTKIILLYCDGVLFQGNNAGPVSVSGTNIYFRGSVNMRSHLKWANKRFNFEKAEKIVFTGSSSGGIATYLWIDYLKGLVSNPKKVYGIVDSGIFLSPVALQQFAYSLFQLSQLFVPTMPAVSSSLSSDSGTVRLDSQKITTPQVSAAVTLAEIMTVTNANQRPPNKKCTDSLAGNSSDWKCLFADYAIDYLQSKLLWIQSQYDTYAIKINLMMTCLTKTSASRFTPKACTPTQLLQIEVYRNLVRSKIFSKLVAKGHSVWSIACSWHTSIFDQSIYYSSEERSPAKGNRTGVQGAAESFVFQNALIRTSDPYPWPSNTQCAY